MLSFSSIAPVLKRSGQTTITHRRYARPLFLHQSFIEYANESIRHSLWARAFYQMHKSAQKSRWVIIRVLGLQMDPHPLSLLAGAHPLRRNPLPQVTSKTPFASAATPCSANHPSHVNNFIKNYWRTTSDVWLGFS